MLRTSTYAASCLATVAALAIAGCGGGGDDRERNSDKPEHVAKVFAEAMQQRDGEKLCGVVARRDELLRRAKVDCAGLGPRIPESTRNNWDPEDIVGPQVAVNGDRAMIKYASSRKLELVKEGDAWKVVVF